MLEIEIAATVDDLAALRADWDELLAASPSDTIFLTWEWTSAWWAAFDGDDHLLLAVREGERLLGLAPLRWRTRRVAGVVPHRLVEFAARPSADYLDVIAQPGREREVQEALLAFLQRYERRWHTLRLTGIPASSPTPAALEVAAAARGLACRVSAGGVCPVLSLAGGWDRYLAGRSTSFRKRLRYLARRAQRTFAVRTECVQAGTALHAAFERMMELHRRQWGPLSPLVTSPGIVDFHHCFLDRAAARGWLRLYGLYFDDELVAAQYWFQRHGVLSYYQGGRDPGYDDWSVGTLLLHDILASADEAAVREVDLLRGGEAYKYRWATDTRPVVDVEIWRRSLLGTLAGIYGGLRRRPAARAGRGEAT